MKNTKLVSTNGIAENQKRKIINNFNLNVENRGIGDFLPNKMHTNSDYRSHYGNVSAEKSERDIPAEVSGRYYATTNQKNEKDSCKLININPTTGEIFNKTCQCSNHWRRNVGTNTILIKTNEKTIYEEKKQDCSILKNGEESDKNGKNHKLMDFPCEIGFINQDENNKESKKYIYHGCFTRDELMNDDFQKLLKSQINEKLNSDYFLPYVTIPQLIYCLNQSSRRAVPEDPYTKSIADASVETTVTNYDKNEDLVEELKTSKTELINESVEKMNTIRKLDEDVEEVKALQDPIPKSSENDPSTRRLLDKDDKNKPTVVQEIKFYEGNLNIFDGGGKNESPYFKITKIVTFESEKEGKSGEKPLGIDSWAQTDDISNENVKELKDDDDVKKNIDKDISSLKPQNEEYPVETATVCSDCLESLVELRNMSTGNMEKEKPEESKYTKMNKSTSTHNPDQNVMDLEMIKDKFVRFIVEIFLEAIPKELYKKMTEPSNRSNNDEIEVRVKSYDTGSLESCDLKSCKMKNPDKKLNERQFKNEPIDEKNREKPKTDNTLNNPSYAPQFDQPKKPLSNESFNSKSPNPKKENEDTYDCQITLNGRKILIKVNKSVEDLLISGNHPSVVRFSPDADVNAIKDKETNLTDQEKKGRYKAETPKKFFLSDNTKNDDQSSIKEHLNNMNRERGREHQRDSVYDNSSIGGYSIPPKFGHSQKKGRSDNPRSSKHPRSVITPSHGANIRKSGKTQTEDKNSVFNNTKNIYWSNTKYFQANKERILKAKKINGKDYEAEIRIRNRPECSFKEYSNQYRNVIDEISKKQNRSKSLRQYDCNYSIFWDPQYLKYYDEILPGNSDESNKNLKANIRREKSHNFATEAENRMITPDIGQCNIVNNPSSMYIVNFPEENCKNPQYRNCTIANVTPMELESNLFDMGTITCKKCIETLKSCSKLIDVNYVGSKQVENFGGSNICDYYYTGNTGNNVKENICSERITSDNIKKSNRNRYNERCNDNLNSTAPVQGNSQNQCPLNEPISMNSQNLGCETIEPEVSPRKMYGICFIVNRIMHDVVPNFKSFCDELPETKDIGVSTACMKMKKYQTEMKTSWTQTTQMSNISDRNIKMEKQKSFLCFSVLTMRNKATQKIDNPDNHSEEQTNTVEKFIIPNFDSTNDNKETQTENIKSNEKILIVNDVSRSEDSITANSEQRIVKRKFSLVRIWPCLWKKKDNDKDSP